MQYNCTVLSMAHRLTVVQGWVRVGAKGGSEGVVLSLHNPFYIEEDRSKGVVEKCRCKVSLDIVVDIEVEKWKYSTNGSRWVALYT